MEAKKVCGNDPISPIEITIPLLSDNMIYVKDDEEGFIDVSEIINDDAEYSKSMPVSDDRFTPTDMELIFCYLMRKNRNEPWPPLNRIHVANIYHYSPDILAERYKANGDKSWYFFSQRDKKYRSGNRPNRVAGNGYWMASGGKKPIRNVNGEHVGDRLPLAYYQGKYRRGTKSMWLMHEYSCINPSEYSIPFQTDQTNSTTKLDGWVLCKIYETPRKSSNKNTNIEPAQVYNPTTTNSDYPQGSREWSLSEEHYIII